MAEQPTHKRRIVARTLFWMALLAVGYFGSYLGMHWAFYNGYGMYAEPVLVHTRPFFRPIESYEESALPFGFDLMTLEIWVCRGGGSWSSARPEAARQMRMRKEWREKKAIIQAAADRTISD